MSYMTDLAAVLNDKFAKKSTGEPRNLLSATTAYTSEGKNKGWTSYESEEAAMTAFNIEKFEEKQ